MAFSAFGQSPVEAALLARWKLGGTIPDKLLSQRSVVLYSHTLQPGDLQAFQRMFEQAGIDAIADFEAERVLSGIEPQRAFSNYFNRRQIAYIIFIYRHGNAYGMAVAPYNRKPSLTDPQAPAWHVRDSTLLQELRTVYTTVSRSQARQNYLVIEVPETELRVNFVRDREERFLPNIRTVKMAIPRFEEARENEALEAFLKANYPARYELVDPHLTDRELTDKGFSHALRFIYTRGHLAKELLLYENRVESAQAIATYREGQLQLKTIPAQSMIYKYYVKELEYGTCFLGTRWDADLTWGDALRNHLDGYKAERRF